jgi:hypothetical protein
MFDLFSWPETQQFVNKHLSGMSGGERQQILLNNTAKLYDIFSPWGEPHHERTR